MEFSKVFIRIPVSNIIKMKQGKNYNEFSKVFIRIPGTYKKTSRSYRIIQVIHKIIWFGVDITRVFPHREITRNISRRKNFFNTKIYSRALKTNPTYFYHCLLLYFRLNKTGNEIFSEQTEFADKIASGFTHITNFKMQN